MRLLSVIALCLCAGTGAAQSVPDIKPGDTCEKLRGAYGKETAQQGPAHIWKQNGVTIRVLVKPNGPCLAGLVEYSVESGHTYTTRDGVTLGRDTLAEAQRKLQGRIDANSYMSLRGEGKAYGQLVVSSAPANPFKGTYSWQLRKSVADTPTNPPRITDFTTEPVIVYSIEAPE
ncbi:MAG TPA: hypothetical protein VF221_23205 [Chloroflexota bacterium]